ALGRRGALREGLAAAPGEPRFIEREKARARMRTAPALQKGHQPGVVAAQVDHRHHRLELIEQGFTARVGAARAHGVTPAAQALGMRANPLEVRADEENARLRRFLHPEWLSCMLLRANAAAICKGPDGLRICGTARADAGAWPKVAAG